MSLLPNYTNANSKEAYFLRANAQLLNVSTLNAGSISTASIQTSSLVGEYLSTIDLDAEYINNSTINTLHVDLDGQILTATSTQLLLNGVPLATLSSLSSLADWSLEPAISSVQMAGNDLNEAGLVSSLNIRSGNGLFNNLVAFNSLFVSSNTSTISSLIESADLGVFSTLNAGDVSTTSLSTTYGCVQGGGELVIANAGPSFTSAGSAVVGFGWDPTPSYRSDIFYDTTLSSLTIKTKSPGGYVDTPSSRLYVQEATTSSLVVSSINGGEFTSTGIVVQVAGVSSLVANSISSLGAQIREALISTIVFSPSLNPSLGGVNVNLGLGGILGNVIGWGAGVLGAATGAVALGTSLIALANGRQTKYIDNSRYELVNGTTQLQFSTLGAPYSSIFRLNSSADPARIPGEEILISTIYPAGVAVRSVSDPINTLSTPNSTIQAFGEWVPVPDELVNVSTFATASISSATISSINGSVYPPAIPPNDDWALYPAVSTINFSTGVTAVVAASPGSDIALTGTSIKLIGGYTDANNLLLASTISTATILGANDNLFGIGVQGLEIRTAPTGQIWISSPQTNVAGLLNTSTTGARRFQGGEAAISTANISSCFVSTLNVAGLSSIVFSTSGTAGLAAQPVGRLMLGGNDLDLGQQDLWAQQVRVGAGNPGGSAQTEVIWYSPDNLTQRGIGLGGSDLTLRIQSTINSGTNNGYILDTTINRPFFSTINNTSTALMAWFPSTTLSSIGISTISIIPVSFQTTSAFSGTLLYPNISSSAVAANVIASTTIQTNAAGSYIIAQANTSFQNATNQYHDIYLNLAIDGALSPSTFTSLPAGLNHYANGSIAYRAAVSSGTHTLVLYASADANAVAVGTQVDIWGTGNLAP